MNYRQIATTFWRDGYISSLTTDEKLVFIYLFANEAVNMTGIYELPDKHILMDTDITKEKLTQIKEKFEKDEKYYFYKQWIYISNFPQYNKFSSAENILKRFVFDFNKIPKIVKEYFFKKKEFKSCFLEQAMVTISDSVMVIVIGVGGKVGDSVGGRLQDVNDIRHNEDIDPETVPL